MPPGDYRLTFEATGPDEKLPTLKWQVACVESDDVLLDHAFLKQGLFGLEPRDTFDVPPEGCAAQFLSLIGVPSNGADGSAVIASVTIERLSR